MDKYVIISAVVAGIVTWLFMYIDARLFDTPKSKFTYFKGVAFVSGLVGTIVYFMKPSSGQLGGGLNPNPNLGAGAGATELVAPL